MVQYRDAGRRAAKGHPRADWNSMKVPQALARETLVADVVVRQQDSSLIEIGDAEADPRDSGEALPARLAAIQPQSTMRTRRAPSARTSGSAVASDRMRSAGSATA